MKRDALPEDGRNVTALQKYRKKKRHWARRGVALLVAAALGLAVYFNRAALSPASVAASVQGLLGEFGDSKFPVAYSQGSFKDAAAFGSDLAVVTDTAFLVYSSTGRLISSRSHGLSNPRIVSSGNRALLYDFDGDSLSLESRFAELFHTTMENAIVAAAVDGSGDCAVATESTSYLGELTVFGSTGNQIFKWYCSTGRILSVALSPDGSEVAASVISSENGEIRSTVTVYDISSSKAVRSTDFDGTLFFSLSWQQNGNILALGDNLAAAFDRSGRKTASTPYSDRTIRCYWAGPSGALLVFSRYGVGQDSTMISLDSNAGVAAQADVSENIKLIAKGSGVAALHSAGLSFYGASLASAGSSDVSVDITKLLCIKDNVYCFTPATVYKAGTTGQNQ